MGILDQFQKEKDIETVVPDPLEAAWIDYKNLCEKLPGTKVEVKLCEPVGDFEVRNYWLAADGERYYLLPECQRQSEDAGRLRAISLRAYARQECRLKKLPTEAKPLGQEGLLSIYEVPVIRLRLTLPDGEILLLQTSSQKANLAKICEWGVDCLPVYDLFPRPEETEMLSCKQGGGLLIDGGRFDVWREEDRLVFLRQSNGLYSLTTKIQRGELAVRTIRVVRETGEATRVPRYVPGSEGGTNVGKAILFGCLLALLGSFLGALLLGWLGLIIGLVGGIIGGIHLASEEGTPARTEYDERDERTVTMDVDLPDGGMTSVVFTREAWEVFHRLLQPAELCGKHQKSGNTSLDELERLAALCEKGYVTREEFDRAKERLLEKI